MRELVFSHTSSTKKVSYSLMGFLHRIKSLLPVSSRSFHDFEGHVNSQLRRLNKVSAAADPRTQLRFWALYQKDGESMADAKRRFFASLPAATGVNLLLQKAQGKLLREFHQMCVDNDLHYWVTGGTLIGAERTGKFIPWDDDVDVAIPRDDLDRLRTILADSTTHRIVTVWDYRGKCEQIRLRTTDPDNPAFVDLFIFDWTNDPTVDMYWASQEYRKHMVTELKERFSLSDWPKIDKLSDSDNLAPQIRDVFNKWVLKEKEEAPYATDREHATGLYRAIENFDDPTHFPYVGPLNEDWLPVGELKFEGFTIWVPKNKSKYLDDVYGDIWELPGDINSHFSHFVGDPLHESASIEAMEKYTGEKLVNLR